MHWCACIVPKRSTIMSPFNADPLSKRPSTCIPLLLMTVGQFLYFSPSISAWAVFIEWPQQQSCCVPPLSPSLFSSLSLFLSFPTQGCALKLRQPYKKMQLSLGPSAHHMHSDAIVSGSGGSPAHQSCYRDSRWHNHWCARTRGFEDKPLCWWQT